MKDYTVAIEKMLVKKAIGFKTKEVVDEYVVEEDGLKLVKRKIKTTQVVPDLAAAKILLEWKKEGTNLDALTDSELMEERNRLLGLLASEQGGQTEKIKETE